MDGSTPGFPVHHQLSPGLLAPIMVVGGGVGDSGSKARARCDLGLHCSRTITPHWGKRQMPSFWSRGPEIHTRAVSTPFKLVLSSLPAQTPPLQRGAMMEQERLLCTSVSLVQSGTQTTSDTLPLQLIVMASPTCSNATSASFSS